VHPVTAPSPARAPRPQQPPPGVAARLARRPVSPGHPGFAGTARGRSSGPSRIARAPASASPPSRRRQQPGPGSGPRLELGTRGVPRRRLTRRAGRAWPPTPLATASPPQGRESGPARAFAGPPPPRCAAGPACAGETAPCAGALGAARAECRILVAGGRWGLLGLTRARGCVVAAWGPRPSALRSDIPATANVHNHRPRSGGS
jgi:hypothetical protein